LAKLELTYAITVRNAHADLPLTAEFAALYPGAAEAITYFPDEHGKPIWRSEAGIYKRYCLSMQFPITISASRIHSSRAGEPEFHLAEVESVEQRPDGQVYVTYGKTQKLFGLREWNLLVKSKGDLSSLGIDFTRDKPIAGFDKFKC
jgi:hypothetical protein